MDQQLARVPIVRLARAAAREEAQDFSIEGEQHVLGALLADGNALPGISGLHTEHFADERHRRIYSAIRDQAEEYGAASVDTVTVGERVARNGNADDRAYIAALAQATPSGRNIECYCELVRAHAQRRQLAALGTELAERATAPSAEIAALVRDATARLTSMQTGKEGLPALDLDELTKREPERPQQIMVGLPCGYATLLAGHGGVGKSQIALHLAVCIARPLQFFGLDVDRRNVLYLACEDRADVLHWRLTRICRHHGIELRSLRGSLEIVDLVGRDALLWERDPRTGYTMTPAYGLLQETLQQHRSEVLIVDGIADVFGGNENSRSEVKRFVNAMVALVPRTGAVLLIGHIAKPAAANAQTAEGYSGSTAWHNACRARWYLYPETTRGEEGERAERTGELILELQKANMGRVDQAIRFAWAEDEHLFLGREAASTFDRKHQEREERAGVLKAFRSCHEAALTVPAAMQGPRTAYHVLSLRTDFPESLRGSGGATSRRFRRILEELRQSRAIEESEYRRTNRHSASQLTITAEGLRHCAE